MDIALQKNDSHFLRFMFFHLFFTSSLWKYFTSRQRIEIFSVDSPSSYQVLWPKRRHLKIYNFDTFLSVSYYTNVIPLRCVFNCLTYFTGWLFGQKSTQTNSAFCFNQLSPIFTGSLYFHRCFQMINNTCKLNSWYPLIMIMMSPTLILNMTMTMTLDKTALPDTDCPKVLTKFCPSESYQ